MLIPKKENAEQSGVFFDSPNFWALCNDTFNWTAVNIPMNLVDKDADDGDLDIIVSMPSVFPPKDDTPPKYRVFEVKVGTVDILGNVKSLKIGKFKKSISQLKKLEKFGCQNIFLFDIIIAQTGYSDLQNIFLPDSILNFVKQKAAILYKSNFGYIITKLEFISGVDELKAGKWFPVTNLTIPKQTEAKNPFLKLADYLGKFYKANNHKTNGFPFISYCKTCKNLVLSGSQDDLKCPNGDHTIL